MKRRLTFYTRRDCCLCDAMKVVLRAAAAQQPFSLEEIDVDSSLELQEQYGDQVPVLFIDGRKAFKYRVTQAALQRRLKARRFAIWNKFRAGFSE
jgi:glutaredoxin